MAARVQRADGPVGDEAALLERLAGQGWRGGYGWGNAPHDSYGEHAHGYDKALYCVSGTIVFSTPDGDVELQPGDRLELDRGTRHSAQVGAAGVRCVEAHRA